MIVMKVEFEETPDKGVMMSLAFEHVGKVTSEEMMAVALCGGKWYASLAEDSHVTTVRREPESSDEGIPEELIEILSKILEEWDDG